MPIIAIACIGCEGKQQRYEPSYVCSDCGAHWCEQCVESVRETEDAEPVSRSCPGCQGTL